MERVPAFVADAIHDVVNALQVAVLLAEQIDRRMSGLRIPIRLSCAEPFTERSRRSHC
jgi:hypothetical protein